MDMMGKEISLEDFGLEKICEAETKMDELIKRVDIVIHHNKLLFELIIKLYKEDNKIVR